MGLVRFLGLRTYSVELRRDLELLEKNFNDLVNRTAVLFPNEPAASFTQTNNNSSGIANHAHRHASGGTTLPFTASDPIGPYNFNWQGVHIFNPKSNITPVTINATNPLGISPMQVWSPLNGASLDSVVSHLGDVGIGEPEPTARLSIRAAEDPPITDADIIALGPYAWWDGNHIDGDGDDNNSAYVQGGNVTSWVDRVNGHTCTVVLTPYTVSKDDPTANNNDIVVGGVNANFDFWSGVGFGNPATWTAFGVIKTPIEGTSNIILGSYPDAFLSGREPAQWSFGDFGLGASPLPATYRPHRGAGQSQTIRAKVIGTPTAWGSYFSCSWRYNGGSSHEAWIQGIPLADDGTNSLSGTSPDTASGFELLGSIRTNGLAFVGTETTFGDVLLFSTALTDEQIAIVHTYLEAKYNAAAASPATSTVQDWKETDGTVNSVVTGAFRFGLGIDEPVAKAHIIATTEQLRIGYDVDNYCSTTVGSTGIVTLDASGGEIVFANLTTHNSGLRIGPTAGFYTRFNLGTQAADITYTLPTANVATGILNNNGTGTLAWSTAATLGLVSGTGTTNRIPKWTSTATQGNSTLAVEDGPTFIATLDTTLMANDAEFYLTSIDTPTYLLTSTGLDAGVIPIVGSNGNNLINPDVDPGTGGISTADVLAYYNVGSLREFQAYTNIVRFIDTTGSMQLLMGDVNGGGSGNSYYSQTLTSGSVTFNIIGSGAHAFTFSRTVAVPDDPYAVGWNGSANVPTKNAVYDKIEAVIAGLTAGANPTASVGLTPVNGSATTFLRSDGAPALDVGIVPTWTGIHTYSAQDVHNAGVSLGTSGALTRAALAAGGGTNLTITPSWTAGTATAGDVGLLIKPNQVMAVNTAIMQIQNSAGSLLFDLRRLGTLAGGGAGNTRYRFGYDSANYYEVAISSAGSVIAASTGAFSFGAGSGNIAFTAAGQVNFSPGSNLAVQFVSNVSTVFADGMVISNAGNTTGLKIGGSGDKIWLGGHTAALTAAYGVTPIVQPTTAVAAATFVANTSLIFDDSATWDGYTIGQVVKALRNLGWLA